MIIFTEMRELHSKHCRSNDTIEIPIGINEANTMETIKLCEKADQHVLISGYAGSGKSTLLHNILCNALLDYSPQDLQFYLMDSGLFEFGPFADKLVPHIWKSCLADTPESVSKMLCEINTELSRREALLYQNGCCSIHEFNKLQIGSRIPRTLVMMDCSNQFICTVFRNMENSQLFAELLSKASALGMMFVLSGHDDILIKSVPFSQLQLFGVRILTHQGSDSAYLLLQDRQFAEKARFLRCGEAIINIPTPHVFNVPYIDRQTENGIIDESII